MSNWNAVAVKAQLRLTAQRLGQLQERQDSQGQVTRKDIANLLQQGDTVLARAKAQALVHDDSLGDLFEALEMHIGLIVEHFGELGELGNSARPLSATVEEAACSIVFAAPHTESKDLHMVRELLISRLGPEFEHTAVNNLHYHVSTRVSRALNAPPPSAAVLDENMMKIAKSHGVQWIPEPRRNDLTNAMIQILDPATAPTVDMVHLRQLCSLGIPDQPSWIRPRAWKLFFGILPVLKSSWDIELHKHRDSYYDLIRRLLTPIASLPPPTNPLIPADMSLQTVFESLARVPESLFIRLQDEPEVSPLSLLDSSASDDLRITCASNLDLRLQMIQESETSKDVNGGTPEIRLERRASDANTLSGRRRGAPTTLLSAKDYTFAGAHKKHTSALFRLLYLHSRLNPHSHSPHTSSLLVPLYTVLLQETDPKDVAHVEADTFWVFEAMIGEFSELDDETGGKVWMKKFSERLAWADAQLSVDLHAKGLDPALPHYSYRWLAPLLTQTLPLTSIFLVWDTLFCCPMRDRDSNAKLDQLLDICTSMLTRARAPLFRLGKSGRRSPSLWAEESAKRPPPSPLRPWELSDAFSEGTSLLQTYPVEAAGGIDAILQAAADLAHRREEDARSPKNGSTGLGSLLKVSIWKGFTAQLSTPADDEGVSSEEEIHDDGDETETPQLLAAPGLTSRLANTVWRGFTNQAAEGLPSPLSATSPASSVPSSPGGSPSPTGSPYKTPLELSPEPEPALSSPKANIWGYAGKLLNKDSDAAASLAKVSSNWRALAMDAWSTRKRGMSLAEGPPTPSSATSELPPSSDAWAPWTRSPMSEPEDRKRASRLPFDDYTPPPRPHFRAPRDSFMPAPRNYPPSNSDGTSPNGSLAHRTRASLASMAGLSSPAPAPPKAGPRPLMLNSSSLITAPKVNVSRSVTPTPRSATSTVPFQGDWANVTRNKHHFRGQSSISSLSPMDALGRPSWPGGNRSDAESDSTGGSRLVPINRRSISPMAPSARIVAGLREHPDSAGSSTSERIPSMPSARTAPSPSSSDRGWGLVDIPDSPKTPMSAPNSAVDVHVASGEHSRFGSINLTDAPVHEIEFTMPPKKPARKNIPAEPVDVDEDTSDSSASGPSAPSFSRVRSKRYPQRPSNLRLGSDTRSSIHEEKTPSPNRLAPEWPEVIGATPTATTFSSEPQSMSPTTPLSAGRVRKVSTGSNKSRTRKLSGDGPTRIRKVSNEGVRYKRESAANEGDDEGYDDLLSAYESEEA